MGNNGLLTSRFVKEQDLQLIEAMYTHYYAHSTFVFYSNL